MKSKPELKGTQGYVQGEFPAKTWADCFGCIISFAAEKECNQWRLHKEPCRAHPIMTLAVSSYAAQLAWWFAHFPPDRFKFFTSTDIHATDPIPFLNSILEFMGLEAHPFSMEILKNVQGYKGEYNITDLSTLDLKAVRLLQLYFRQANADLRELLAPLGVGSIAPEIGLSHT
jgi:hypothetical protein